jgi:hypothetical protein
MKVPEGDDDESDDLNSDDYESWETPEKSSHDPHDPLIRYFEWVFFGLLASIFISAFFVVPLLHEFLFVPFTLVYIVVWWKGKAERNKP